MIDPHRLPPLQASVARLRKVTESARGADSPALHDLLNVIAAELQALSAQLDQIYDESFVESADGGGPATCAH